MLDWVTVGGCQLKVSFCLSVSLRALSPGALVGQNLDHFLEIITVPYNFSRFRGSVVWGRKRYNIQGIGVLSSNSDQSGHVELGGHQNQIPELWTLYGIPIISLSPTC